MIKNIKFTPLKGLSSPHLQMLVAFSIPKSAEPPSVQKIYTLHDGDKLSCHVSTPPEWTPINNTIVLIHGLGGSHLSPYMIRLSKKFYSQGHKVVRINLRGCGTGKGLNNRVYSAASSDDLLHVLQSINQQYPLSKVNLMGFSLGGSLIIKMAGEHSEYTSKHVNRMIAVCPPIDLHDTHIQMSSRSNTLYNKYFLKHMVLQSDHIVKDSTLKSVHDFNEKVTSKHWGFNCAYEYYHECSAKRFIPRMKNVCDILLSADDPFISCKTIHDVEANSNMRVWIAPHGAHMGFIGRHEFRNGLFWLDNFLLDWNEASSSEAIDSRFAL